MSRKTENEAWHAGFTACANEHTRQRREPEYPITREVPEQYRWTQDYNETLVSQAGGDGDNADIVTLRVKKHHADVEAVAFTNVLMHHVHAAIAVLNGDQEGMPEGTREFTLTELFGWYDGVKAAERLINCHECGSVISYDSEMMEKHRTWHNKTLP